jgi:biotin carboxylase
MPRVLLLLPTNTYRTHDFVEAAGKLGVDVVVASDEPSTMEPFEPGSLLTVDFLKPDEAAKKAAEFYQRYPFEAVVPVDEDTAVTAAAIAQAVGLPHNSSQAATATRLKHVMRDMLSRADVHVPTHHLFSSEDDPRDLARRVRYPSVLKPVFLAASRGVIRADDPEQFVSAFHRVAAILREPDVAKRGGELARMILVEDYVPGTEIALEGLLTHGELRVLALFDKPDPMEGPLFAETIYVTPSRLPPAVQSELASSAAKAAAALGLREGPIHAELRANPEGVWVIEVAGRSIGGLCSRTLRFGVGLSLEELLLRHALGTDVAGLSRESRAAGVLMLPIPTAGCLEEIRGLDQSRAVSGIEEVTITAHLGQHLVPLPEGSSYLGFIFARAEDPQEVVDALREAERRLDFVIAR